MHANHAQMSPSGVNSRMRNGSVESVGAESVEDLTVSQRNLERAISALTVDITRKFNDLAEMNRELQEKVKITYGSEPASENGGEKKGVLVRSVSRSKIEKALEKRTNSKLGRAGSKRIYPNADDTLVLAPIVNSEVVDSATPENR